MNNTLSFIKSFIKQLVVYALISNHNPYDREHKQKMSKSFKATCLFIFRYKISNFLINKLLPLNLI